MGKKVALVALALLVAAAVFTIINRGISVRQSQSHEAKYSQEKMKDSEASKEGNETELELLVRELSLEERIGQLIFGGFSSQALNHEIESLIHQYKIGGVIFYGDNLEAPEQTVELVNDIKRSNEENPLPLFLGVDQEGGPVSRLPGELIQLPTNEEVGKRNDQQFSYEIGTLLGKQLKSFGFNLDFAPVLDVNSNPNNPVIGERSFGDNADIVSQLGVQTMKGIQAENIVSVIKHFPGHGDTDVDSHLQLPEVNKSYEGLNTVELVPFMQAIENGADTIMLAHILLPKIDDEYPATMSEEIVTELLRKELGFEGVVITDDMTMNAITDNYDLGQAAVRSIKAGSDIVLVAHDYHLVVTVADALIAAVENGELSEERINESVERIIKLKQKYSIDDEPIQTVNMDEINKAIENALNG